MPTHHARGLPLTRRRFIGAAGAVLAAGFPRPALSLSASRPVFTHGVQSGDVDATLGHGLDPRRPAGAGADGIRHHRELRRSGAPRPARRAARERLRGEAAARPACRRTRTSSTAWSPSDLCSPSALSEPVVGRFRTAPASRRDRALRLVRRHRRPGLGHRRRRACGPTRRSPATRRTSSSIAATRSTPTVR